MNRHRIAKEEREFAEERESLIRIAAGPLLWAAHFALSYASVAVYCAKWGPALGGLTTLRVAFAVATTAVLIAIVVLGWRSWRQWDARVGRSSRQVLEDLVEEHEDRHEFLGHAAFLLAIISFVGVVYTALPVALIGGCG